MKRIGMIGCGNIAGLIAELSLKEAVAAVFDRHRDRSEQIAAKHSAKAYTEFAQFINEPLDLVIEVASIEAVQNYAETILRRECDLMILSAGALADEKLKQDLLNMAKEKKRRILVPSGALFGLDNAKIARVGKVHTLTMKTTKSPQSYNIQTAKRRCLFRGSANECIRHFPRNVNAAVALGLAAQKEVEIELWADPLVETNSHEVHICGSFGEAMLTIANRPSLHNPATSFLAALSVVAMANTLDSPLLIGT